MKQTKHFRCLFLCNLFNITANWTELAFTVGFNRHFLTQCYYLNLLTSTMCLLHIQYVLLNPDSISA